MGTRSLGEYTPTEQRMLRVLLDNREHPREELVACIADELANKYALVFHISKLRRKLERKGKTIAYRRVSGKGYYQICQIIYFDRE